MDTLTRLAVAARDGDRQALVALVRGTQADVWAFCASVSGQAAADDLTQETYARALSGLHRFRADASVRTWLLAIARNVAADAVRSTVRARERETRNGADDGTYPARIDETIALRSLIENLSKDRREAFVMTQLLGLSYAEAADVCGCPVGTIRSRVARARAELVHAVRRDRPATGRAAAR